MKHNVLLIVLCTSFLPLTTLAQEDETEKATPAQEIDIEALKEELRREMREEIEARDSENKKRIEALEAQLEEQELAALEEMTADVDGFEKYFNVYGFFDLTFFNIFMEENSPYKLFVHDRSTFLLSNVNLYVSSQMTETLSALVELKFTFAPQGKILEYEYFNYPGVAFERVDTEIQDFYSVERSKLGGVRIERAHMAYSPVDWFNVIAGRYLTPFGIWNVDHASTVRLTTRVPFTQTIGFLTPAQTGLQVFGRFFPVQRVFLDYAITLSNGRGPINEIVDIDDNKAVGLKLKLTYQADNFNIALGGYGYMGQVSDSKMVLHVVGLDPEITPEEPIKVETAMMMKYDEYVVSTDLTIEIFGFKLQGEYIWQRTAMEKSPARDFSVGLFAGGTGMADIYMPSYIGTAAYGLLSYRIPLLGEMALTPYFLFEYSSYDDTADFSRSVFYIGGLNFAPSRYITLKLDAGVTKPLHEGMGDGIKSIAGQIAVSF